MTDKQIIIDGTKINPNDWLDPYKPIPACEIKDCNELVYCGDGILGCRIAEDGLVCDDFNNDDECCMYRQLEYYKEALKAKEQECEELREAKKNSLCAWKSLEGTLCPEAQEQLDQLKEQLEAYKMEADEGKEINAELKAELTRANCQIADDEILQCDMREAIEELKAENDELKETFDGLLKIQYKLADNCKKLRQCLTEIKEIAEHCIKQDICTTCDNSDKCHIEDEEIPTYDVCKLILQKISEVEK